jgi:hypothetical protein
MEKVYARIETAARNGDSSITIGEGCYNQRDVDRVIKQLRADGYTVKREHGCDQRDNESWDYLIVSW